MPGLVGMIGPKLSGHKEAEIHQMVDALSHESFDIKGSYTNADIGIQIGWVARKDLYVPEMPIWNETEDIGIVFSGESFPDPDDIASLRSKGHNFIPENASYLVHLYEENEHAFFRKLNGRFSGVVIDLRLHRAILFNDRYGLNRLYYHENDDGFYFASEAKSLLRALPGLRDLDYRSLGEAFALGCVLQNRTLFREITLLPGGSAWTFSPGEKIRRRVFFRPEEWEGQEKLAGNAYFEKFMETWARVLPRYLRGPERVAVSLTGGQDSRMIMAWARSAPGALPCYTFGGPFRECQDVKLARLVAMACGQSHQVISLGEGFFKEFPSLAKKTVYITDGAMDVSGAAELYVNRIAREIAPIRLSGNYGQEILQSFVAFRPKRIHEGFLQGDFRRALATAGRTYNDESGSIALSFVAFKQMPWHHFSRLHLELSQLTLRSPYLDNDIVALAYRAPAGPSENKEFQLKLIAKGNPALGLIPTDRGVLRTPPPLITVVNRLFQQFTVKAEYAYDYGMPRWLAKIDGALRLLHPEKIFLGRHKFSHFRIWYRDELSTFVKEVLLDPSSLKRPYLDGRRLESMVLEHTNGIGNYTSEIHQLLTVELFHRLFLAPE